MINRAITIYAAGGRSIGHGHIMRTLAVAQQLAKRGCDIEFLTDDPVSERFVNASGFSISVVKDGLQSLLERGASYALVDSYRITEEWLEAFAERRSVAMFEDGCRLNRYAADVVIDSAAGSSRLPYRGRDTTLFLLEPRYFPLRAELKVQPNGISQDQILVTFGGSDPDDVSSRVFSLVRTTFPSINVTVILGGSYGGRLRPLQVEKTSIVAAPKSIAWHFSRARVAIAGAGQTALELAYFGVPSILLRLSRDQEQVATGLTVQGAALDCGIHYTCADGCIVANLERLLAHAVERHKMRDAGQRLVDGHGAERVADAIISAWFR